MGIGAQRINLAVMLASSRVIALAAAPEHDQVLAEPGLVPVVAEREPAAESLAIGQAAARARVIVRAEAPVLAIVPAEALVLVIVLVEAAPEQDLVEAELERVLVAAELEHAPVAAAPERGPVAVPLRTKSVIAVHHRGRVPLLTAVEDLVVVAQTMREQAATEAATAWGVAG